MVTSSRIVIARHRRGLSVTALARSLSVARQTVAAWEAGTQEPTQENLLSLARALDFPVSFFVGHDVEAVPVGAVSFRAMSKMTASTRDAALAAGRIALMINEWIEARYDLPRPDVPVLTGMSPAQAADFVRHEWGFGNGPIPNLTHLLEAKGVRVFSLPAEFRAVDAYSLRWFDTPVVVVTPGKSAERRRFDLAHELGHLVLHSEREGFQGQQAEDDANQFARELLMPRQGLLARPLRSATLDAVLVERTRWRVSAMALVYRLHNLGFLSEWEYRNHCVELSRRGYRSAEPGGIAHESSLLLGKVLRSLRAKNVGLADIAGDIGVTLHELTQHLLELVVMPLPDPVPAAPGGGHQTGANSPLRLA